MPNITSVTCSFENGIKREEYGPVKKAGASITASVAENEDGAAVLADIGKIALAQVAALLDAPKPAVTAAEPQPAAAEPAAPGEPPARRGRGRPKKDEPANEATAPSSDEATSTDAGVTTSDSGPTATTDASPSDDEWASAPEDIQITDAEILAATSKRAGELGAREPIVKLIASFATRTEGAPFKVQEIPQAQRKDYLNKLAALTA